jgi:hypothetical protein
MEPAQTRPRHEAIDDDLLVHEWQRPRSPSAPVAPYGPSAWSCRCGTGTSASTVSGAAWSQPTARTCAAGGPPTIADAAGPQEPQLDKRGS